MTLTIPPVDGLLYTWQQGDTLQKVADEFKAKVDDILNWPGNNLDLTNPQITPGTVIMVPGGQRPLIDWDSIHSHDLARHNWRRHRHIQRWHSTMRRGTFWSGFGLAHIGRIACPLRQ